MHLYLLIVAIVCFHQMLGVNAQHSNFSLSAIHLSSGMAVLHVALSFTTLDARKNHSCCGYIHA